MRVLVLNNMLQVGSVNLKILAGTFVVIILTLLMCLIPVVILGLILERMTVIMYAHSQVRVSGLWSWCF